MVEYISKIATNLGNYLILFHKKIVYIFFVIYIFLALIVVFSFSNLAVARLANTFGELALLTYTLTLIPGMAKRFGMNYLLITILMLYRRQIGILMFLLALTHMILSGMFLSLQPFVVASTMAMIILFLLFITSNNISQKKLSHNWYKLQKLTYLVMFLIMIHVALIGSIKYATLLLFIGILQIISFIYKRYTT